MRQVTVPWCAPKSYSGAWKRSSVKGRVSTTISRDSGV